MLCYCKSNRNFSDCCKPLILKHQKAETPEQLMRSRFTAFATGKIEYLIETSSKNILSSLTTEELQQTCQTFEFVDLQIVAATSTSVQFIAHLLLEDQHHTIAELSYFIEQDGQWLYDRGELEDTPVIKIGRNDLCPCQSGKKFKKCHFK